MKRFAMILLAAVSLVGMSGFASAQSHGGMHGGGGGGSWSGGGWHGGGGGWHGGSGGWHGGGGYWHGGGGYWHGGYRGGGWGWYWPGVAIGWGWGWPYYYPYYGGYYGAGYGSYPYGADYSTQTYIQQDAPAYSEGQGQFSQGGPAFLYYCPDPAGYYPQVPSCSKGWMRVLPPGAPGPGAPAQP